MDKQKIDVSISRLKEMEQDFRKISNALSQIEYVMKNVAHENIAYWEGRSKKRYQEKTKKLFQNVVRLKEDILKKQQVLTEVTAIYEETEGKSKHVVDALSVDDIF